MITVTIAAADNEPYTVRWQTKILKDGVVTWHDEEVVNEVGKSQPYGIYKDSIRLIVEDGHRVDPSPVSTKEGTE